MMWGNTSSIGRIHYWWCGSWCATSEGTHVSSHGNRHDGQAWWSHDKTAGKWIFHNHEHTSASDVWCKLCVHGDEATTCLMSCCFVMLATTKDTWTRTHNLSACICCLEQDMHDVPIRTCMRISTWCISNESETQSESDKSHVTNVTCLWFTLSLSLIWDEKKILRR